MQNPNKIPRTDKITNPPIPNPSTSIRYSASVQDRYIQSSLLGFGLDSNQDQYWVRPLGLTQYWSWFESRPNPKSQIPILKTAKYRILVLGFGMGGYIISMQYVPVVVHTLAHGHERVTVLVRDRLLSRRRSLDRYSARSQKQICRRSVPYFRVKVNKFWKLGHVLSAIYDRSATDLNGDPGLVFNPIANDSRLLKAHV